MRLISDSGSTKTDWAIESGGKIVKRFATGGLNPAVTGLDAFCRLLGRELPPETNGYAIGEIEFYGAGCTGGMQTGVRDCLAGMFPSCRKITVESDLLGACRALCGENEGVVAILGTGSNSCVYDGKNIVMHVPPLGYILGDEGSGAALGRIFLNALLRGRLPENVEKAFYTDRAVTPSGIMHAVYRGGAPNAVWATMAPFIHSWSREESVRELVVRNFRDFIRQAIRRYDRPDMPVNCIGGMAFHFHECLKEAAGQEGYKIGRVLYHPVESLINWKRSAGET